MAFDFKSSCRDFQDSAGYSGADLSYFLKTRQTCTDMGQEGSVPDLRNCSRISGSGSSSSSSPMNSIESVASSGAGPCMKGARRSLGLRGLRLVVLTFSLI